MHESYDVAVIGGGVQGCGVAQAAAAAGYKTLLIDQAGWGEATSSASSKLIHGGLRYLQTGQFKLVRECLHERNWMLDHSPTLVKPNWFYLPVYQHSQYSRSTLLAGLSLYWMLNPSSPYSRFRQIPKTQWSSLDGLNTDGLKAVFAYQDGQTDDRQLTNAIQQSAQALGANCYPATKLDAATCDENGFTLHLQHADDPTTCHAAVVVNATGPWVNQTLGQFTPARETVDVDLVQGTHVVLKERISDQCFYLEAPSDGRAVFVLPWHQSTLVGTTETLYQGDPGQVQPLQSEIDYLMATLSHYFADATPTVDAAFAGLRVLPKQAASAFSRPRDVMLHEQGDLISLYGGKLTAWRATAEQVLNLIETRLGQRKNIDTRSLALNHQ